MPSAVTVMAFLRRSVGSGARGDQAVVLEIVEDAGPVLGAEGEAAAEFGLGDGSTLIEARANLGKVVPVP
ncbi:hypothetical protein [Streptomyces sp. NPDC000229]|uniref:hypothetical protein n=1 Tax=Streptomyces sp. NPDC000229 TaxID=3154247 RepID=UPI0033167EC9